MHPFRQEPTYGQAHQFGTMAKLLRVADVNSVRGADRDGLNGIWRQPINGGAPQRLPGLPEEKLFPYGWSSDGRQFAFTRGSEICDVVLMRNFR